MMSGGGGSLGIGDEKLVRKMRLTVEFSAPPPRHNYFPSIKSYRTVVVHSSTVT